MQYKKASPNDMEKLKRIARSVIRHNYTPFLGVDAVTSFIESGMADKEIEEGLNTCTLLQKDSGAIAFSITKEDLLHLIMVDVPFQNAGYGRMLLLHTEAELFRFYNRIRLQSFIENSAAARFYTKHGWQVVKKTDMPEMGVTLVQYEKVKP